VPFAARSFWQQPWRSYMDTWPASRLRRGIGINFGVAPIESAATAKLLAASGFRRARVELPWNAVSFDDPSKLGAGQESSIRTRLLALRDNGIRPLILLNSNEREPTPTTVVTVTVLADAAAGATSVQLDPATTGALVAGRSGFDFDGMAAGVLITAIDASGSATLSRPLPTTLTAGPRAARILRFEPFAPPLLADGSPNPRFERTLTGWLQYVKTTTTYVKSVLGTDDFDVEIWNEVTFGARFLWNKFYYAVPPEAGDGDPKDVLLRRTVAFLRDPANGVSHVRIGDGFANQTQVPAGSTEPVGVTAIDKHPYFDGTSYPRYINFSGIKPIDALGNPNFTLVNGTYKDTFAPTFWEYMPEHFLTAFQTETLIRDLSPVTTLGWKNTPHGRFTAPSGGDPPEMWVTEYNLNADAMRLIIKPAMTADEKDHLRAKVALRALTSYLNKGATHVDLFAAKSTDAWQLIPQRFFDALRANPNAYPSVDPGPVMRSVGRLASAMSGPETISAPRSLTLDRISDTHDNKIFEGNGTAAYPPLYHRDMLAFFPFQADAHRFVVPVYVMTTDLSVVYAPTAAAGTPGRLDLPDEQFELTIGGVNGPNTSVSYNDPITGAVLPAAITASTATTVTVKVPATDYPRLLTIIDGSDPLPIPTPIPTPTTTPAPTPTPGPAPTPTPVPTPTPSPVPDATATPPPDNAPAVDSNWPAGQGSGALAGPALPSPATPTKPPAVSIGRVRILRAGRSVRVSLPITCSRACTIRVVVHPERRRSGASTTMLLDAVRELGPGRRRTLSLKLTRRGANWLAAQPRAWLRGTITVWPDGQPARARQVRLRASSR
jgi:hypothetical protein